MPVSNCRHVIATIATGMVLVLAALAPAAAAELYDLDVNISKGDHSAYVRVSFIADTNRVFAVYETSQSVSAAIGGAASTRGKFISYGKSSCKNAPHSQNHGVSLTYSIDRYCISVDRKSGGYQVSLVVEQEYTPDAIPLKTYSRQDLVLMVSKGRGEKCSVKLMNGQTTLRATQTSTGESVDAGTSSLRGGRVKVNRCTVEAGNL